MAGRLLALQETERGSTMAAHLVLPLHADVQGLHAAQEEVRRVRVNGPPQHVVHGANRRHHISLACQRAYFGSHNQSVIQSATEEPEGCDANAREREGALEEKSDSTCHDIVMAGQVLGGGVDDNVGTEGDGTLVDGGGECGVDAHQRAGRMAQPRNGGHIHAAQVGVGRRL